LLLKTVWSVLIGSENYLLSSRQDISMKLWFPGLSDGTLESIETTDQKRPDGTYSPEFIIWMRNGDALDQVPSILKELPCLTH
jgi:hypothetical protein